MAMFGRFFITYAMNTGTQITFEVVPTELRGQGNALANVFGQLGMFFSPYVVYSAWMPDAYSRIFRSYVFGPSGFWTMAPLRCKI